MVRRIGRVVTTPLASVAERSAAARSRQLRFKRRAQYVCRANQSASTLLARLGDDAVLRMKSNADAGLASGDFETYALWQRRRRAAERLLKTLGTSVPYPGGKV